VIDAHLERIESVNPLVNALRVTLSEQARAQADRADARLAAGDPTGPLHSVPFSVKENIDVAGTATTWGVRAMAEAVCEIDAPLVENFAPPARSRSRAPTCRISRCAGTPTTS